MACLLGVIAVSVGMFHHDTESPVEQVNAVPPLPPVAPTRFRNAVGDVPYVGSERCAGCHSQQHDSYLLTAHSRSLQKVDLDDEPPDGQFDHKPSGRSYRVLRKDGQIRHQEFIRTSLGEEITLSDFDVKYLMGSGRHTRSYVIETDGFLVESPITWYESRAEWGMSPGEGYNVAQHWAFERPIDERCVFCHVGQAQVKDGSPARMDFPAMAIDCERCHGPGGLHVAKWNSTEAVRSGTDKQEDTSIVHPGRLTRERQEDICAQCHLSGIAAAEVRTRSLFDYRPGLNLSDFVVNYGRSASDRQMRVVGHVDQMRLSRCYTESGTLTCVTCHDPHLTIDPEMRPEWYRNQCLACHDVTSCGIPADHAQRLQQQDNCITCHMPQAPTADIPHIAFTHHRIGIHDDSHGTDDADAASSDRQLHAIVDTSGLTPYDQDRCLALAYMDYSDTSLQGAEFQQVRATGRKMLRQILAAGDPDAEVLAALAMSYRHEDPRRAIRYATQALQHSDLSLTNRVNVLWIAGSASFDTGNFPQAISFLERLREIQRSAETFLLLDICYHQEGRFAESLKAAQQAAEISPWRADLQNRLAELYAQNGQQDLAAHHDRRARELLDALGTPSP